MLKIEKTVHNFAKGFYKRLNQINIAKADRAKALLENETDDTKKQKLQNQYNKYADRAADTAIHQIYHERLSVDAEEVVAPTTEEE
jgi:hypothetical protein